MRSIASMHSVIVFVGVCSSILSGLAASRVESGRLIAPPRHVSHFRGGQTCHQLEANVPCPVVNELGCSAGTCVPETTTIDGQSYTFIVCSLETQSLSKNISQTYPPGATTNNLVGRMDSGIGVLRCRVQEVCANTCIDPMETEGEQIPENWQCAGTWTSIIDDGITPWVLKGATCPQPSGGIANRVMDDGKMFGEGPILATAAQ